jgi:N-methylhydantoinase A
VLQERIAGPLGLSLLDAAHGVYVIAAARMIRAVKAVSTYRGRDPRDFALLGFGGNGAVFAAEMARALQMRRVLVPPAPGLFSAFGLLYAHVEYQFVQTHLRRGSAVDLPALNAAYAGLEAQAGAALLGDGYRPEQISIRRFADLRYAGQAYELTVPAPAGKLDAGHLRRLTEEFGREHERVYGHRAIDEPVDLVNLRVAGCVQGGEQHYDPAAAIRAGAGRVAGGPSSRPAYWGPAAGILDTPILSRADLLDRQVEGPAIIEEYDATVVVPPACVATLDAWGNIVIDIHDMGAA